MNTFDFNRPITAHALNESLYKQFNVKINFDKYTREELENYRNILRTKVHQVESHANFNELLTDDTYQKDKFILGVLNTRIKEMLGEAKLSEKAVSKAQQKFMGMVYAAKKGEKPASKAVAKAAKGMSKKAAHDYAATKQKGLPAHKSDESQVNELSPETVKSYTNKAVDSGVKTMQAQQKKKYASDVAADQKTIDKRVRGLKMAKKRMSDESVEEGTKMKTTKKSKPDFLDMDKDGNKKEPMKKAIKDKKIKEAAKPDYIDLDKDGNKKETMKKAAADKKKTKVKESIHDLRHRAYQNFIAEGLATYIAEDEEGKAKAITAGVDMVNDFTTWMQRVGNYQTKSMIELADNIRANFGVQEAETFKQAVGVALENALNALTQTREEINNAVSVLAGEAPAQEPMGQEPGADMAGGPMPEPAEDDTLNLPTVDDEFGASDAAAGGPETSGRMKRESIERGNRLMRILGA